MSLDLPAQLARLRVKGEDHARSAAALAEVFPNANPYDAPISKAIRHRTLLYELDNRLNREEYAVVARAAAVVGDREHYVRYAITDGPAFLLRFGEYDLYEQLSYELPVFENAVYSPTGRWGLLISQEGHACVGGPEDFIGALHEGYAEMGRPVDEQVREFVTDVDSGWIEGPGEGWLEPLLVHIFGAARAKAVIAETREDRGSHE